MDLLRLFTSLIAAHRQQQQTLALQEEIHTEILAQLLEQEDVNSRTRSNNEVIEDAEAHLILLEEVLKGGKLSHVKCRLAGLLGKVTPSFRAEEPNYEMLKAGLLDHAREADIQRQQAFSSVRFDPQKGPRELGQGLVGAAQRWLRPERRTAMEVVRCVTLQRFVSLLPEDAGAHVLNQCPQDMEQAVCMAEEYIQALTETHSSLTHIHTVGYPSSQPAREQEQGGANHLHFEEIQGEGRDKVVLLEGGIMKEEVDDCLVADISGMGIDGSGLYCEAGRASGAEDDTANTERVQLRNMTNMVPPSDTPKRDASASEVGEAVSVTASHLHSSKQPCLESSSLYIQPHPSHRYNSRDLKSFSCLDCDQRFECQKDLTQHRRSHAKTHCCSECGKSFRDSFNLKCHMRTHTGERPHTCHYCGKTFAQEHGLLQHLNIHTGARPFCCTVCGMGFHHSRTLKKHIVLHSQDRPFLCAHCGVTFKLNDTLKRHLKTHAGEGVRAVNKH